MTDHASIKTLAAARPRPACQARELLTEDERSRMFARITRELREPLAGRRQERRTYRRLAASAAAAGIAAAVVGAVVVATGGGPARTDRDGSGLRLASAPQPRGTTIKARLISAIEGLDDDVIESTTTWSDGEYLDIWANGNGTVTRTAQSGWPETLATVGSTGTTFEAVYPADKTWTTTTYADTEPLGLVGTIDELQQQVQSGSLSELAANVSVDGQVTDEYLLADPPLPASADSDLWVNALTDLPVREAAPGAATGATEWAYYTPTPNALAELTLQIPSGFTEVPFPASTSPNDAWCRVHQTCLTYPQTLPLPASTTATSVPAAVTTVPTATTTVPAPTGGAA